MADAAKADATELGRRLGEWKITLGHYDVIIAPLETRIARLTAQADVLKDSRGSQATRTASIKEITAKWDNSDATTRRVLTWETFGFGIERLIRQIKNLGRYLDADICFGINEAGLVMATFLASAQFGRCAVGYLRCKKVRDDLALDDASFYPDARDAPTIVICDFEVKHADVVGFVARQIRARYPRAELYFAVFGAMTRDNDLEVDSIDDLTGGKIMRAAGFQAIFIAATMSPPGIEPPLELR
jgi:hypothetical protein